MANATQTDYIGFLKKTTNYKKHTCLYKKTA